MNKVEEENKETPEVEIEVNMNNVQGSIEHDSSDEEIRPANLSDEFEEVGMVIPTMDEEDDYEKV